MNIRSWKFNRDIIRIKLDDIYYIESYNRKTVVHTSFGTYRIQTTLNREEELLKEYGFLRAHRGYLVHTAYIRALKGNYLVLQNGTQIPVSYRKRKKILQDLMER